LLKEGEILFLTICKKLFLQNVKKSISPARGKSCTALEHGLHGYVEQPLKSLGE